MASLDGYSVLVTGGGSGIGEGCAVALARDGAVVTICGRTVDRLEAAAARIRDAVPGAGVHVIGADVTDETQVDAAVARAVEEGGGLNGVVASAGGSLHMGPVHMADVEAVRATLDLNVVGTFLTLKAAAPHLAARQGSFVGVSSHAGLDSFRFLGIYGAAKAGLDQLLRVAADELGSARVRVNSIRPGIIDNELMSAITQGGPVMDSYLAEIPLHRAGTVDDVGGLARFLIGPESSYITGQCISIDGGQSLRKGADYGAFAEGAYSADPAWNLVVEQDSGGGA
ncbi:MAG TPA: SDR family oxidoreductase [Acidimicrobiia bacterium]|nr:SDR family oxidoreductase [Acidimicrobiia bacterium]